MLREMMGFIHWLGTIGISLALIYTVAKITGYMLCFFSIYHSDVAFYNAKYA